MMSFLRTLLAVNLLLLAPAALAAEKTPTAKTEKLTVLLDWFVNPDHGPLYVALEKGFFTEAGLDVTLIAPADPNDPPKLLAAGQGDVAISYQPQLHMQIDAGLPVIRIGTLIDAPLNTVVVLADGPVRSIADLKGRKVGYSVAGFEDAILGAMLEHHGLTLKDVTLVGVNFALGASLMAGQVDAVVGAYRNFELNQMDIEGRPGRAFHPEEEGVPPFDELVFIAHRDKVTDPRLPRFMRAIERAALFLVNRPNDAWALFIKGRPDLDTELNRRAWRDTIARFAQAPGALDTGRYERFARFLKDRGLIKTLVPVQQLAVTLP